MRGFLHRVGSPPSATAAAVIVVAGPVAAAGSVFRTKTTLPACISSLPLLLFVSSSSSVMSRFGPAALSSCSPSRTASFGSPCVTSRRGMTSTPASPPPPPPPPPPSSPPPPPPPAATSSSSSPSTHGDGDGRVAEEEKGDTPSTAGTSSTVASAGAESREGSAPGPLHDSPRNGSAAGGSSQDTTTTGVRKTTFRRYYFQPWQEAALRHLEADMRHDTTNGLSSTTSLGVATPPRYVYVFGDQLGPRPLVILDQSQQQPSSSSVSDASKSASPSDHEEQVEICGLQKYEPMLQALNWEHGVLYIPLSVAVKHHKTQKCEEGEGKDDEKKKGIDNTLREDMKDDDVIGLSCEQVRMVLDMLDIRWTHYLTYSYGALVAARMASSPISRNTTTTTNTRASLEGRYAHRIGTVLLLDTPLITGAMLENFRRREELKAAEADVNVPHQALSAAKARLLASLEPPLPTPCRADQTLFHQYLFEPSVLFPPPSSSSSHDHPHEAGGDGDSPQRGLRREDRRYVPLQDLLDFSHPIDLIVPAEGAVADVPAFKEVFGVRRPSVVKSAKLSASSSSSSAAEEKGGTPVGSSSPSSKSKSKSKASSAAASPTGEVGGPGEDHPTADATRTESVLFECMDASHGDSSTATAVATEMAQLIRNWMLRYEPDAYIQRQFQQAVTEMKQLLSAGSSAGGEVNAKENTKEKKKKEKKKKK